MMVSYGFEHIIVVTKVYIIISGVTDVWLYNYILISNFVHDLTLYVDLFRGKVFLAAILCGFTLTDLLSAIHLKEHVCANIIPRS